MKLVHNTCQFSFFFTFLPTSNHLHPLEDENCDRNSRLVVDEDDNVKSGLKGLNFHFSSVFLILRKFTLKKSHCVLGFSYIDISL